LVGSAFGFPCRAGLEAAGRGFFLAPDDGYNTPMSRRFPKGLKITDVVVGKGPVAEPGATVTVEWRGYLNRGEEFRNGTTSFTVGRREVIAGLERGTVGMQVGGIRRPRFGPHLGYRDQGVPGIPPNAVLEFEVKLLAVSESNASP
jgi:FKBP-type peptidyl-prolyl cis-trans isomerase